MKNNIKILMMILLLSIINSCTKLDSTLYDKVTTFWQTPDQIAAGVAPAYSSLRNYAPASSMFDINELSSDEVIVPTRGIDWSDNITWRQMWTHTWDANNSMFEDGWQFIYGGIAQVNSILEAFSDVNPKPADSSSIEAELKTVRAFYYYIGLDLFGNIPIAENNHVAQSQLGNKSRKDVFAYIEKEL